MQEKWPRQPLIIMPNLPLAWLAGYWVVVTMLRGCGLTVVRPTGDQVELALMVAVVWIVASGANQLLIYQNAPLTAANRYKDLAMVNALALICTIVLAWGKPAVILFPRQLSSLTALMLALTLLVAGIGNYFVVVTRVRHGRLSLWLGSGALALSAVAAPLLFASSDRLSWLLAAILVALIQASVCWQLPRLLAAAASITCWSALCWRPCLPASSWEWPPSPSSGYGPFTAAWRSAGAFPGWPSVVEPW